MSNARALGLLVALAALPVRAAGPPQSQANQTVEATYPGLVPGALASATLGDLPPGVLLRAGKLEITQKALDDILAKAPKALRGQLRKNALFVLEELATKKLLLLAARRAAATSQKNLVGKADAEVVSDYLQAMVADVKVADAEIARFYAENQDMFGGAKLEKIKARLRQYLLRAKRQEAVDRHVRGLGKVCHAVLSAAWTKEQALLATDNPVDKARASGRPSLVDFGASGCRPCDMMAPILVALREKYKGRANVVFVHVRKEPILAARYGIKSIPVQIFFDKSGKEVFRHTGFFAEHEIEKKLASMGVR